jgi:hypothetical protein
MRWLALVGLLLLTGCPSTPSLPPEAGPAPAPIVKVPVLVKLPLLMTLPCAEPPSVPIETDVDLLNNRDAWRVTARCANQKLRDIDQAESQAIGDPQP